MAARYATKQEIARWNELILSGPDGGNVFASYEYAIQQELSGYKARFIIADEQAVTILEKSPLSLGRLWYLPKGPGVTSTKQLFQILDALKALAKKRRVFVIRIESELPRDEQPTITRHGLVKAKPIIISPSTITMDISKSLDKIMAHLPQEGRLAIKRAKRSGVTVKKVKTGDKNCKVMYELLTKTGDDKSDVKSYGYFHTFWQRFEAAGIGQMFFAYHDDKVVAGAFAMTFGAKSTLKDSADAHDNTARNANYLLQWNIIEWAKRRGADLHDFCGSPPSDEVNNTDHPYYHIGMFKAALSKTVVDYIGCFDLVLRKTHYKAWVKIGERVANKVRRYSHRESYY